MRSIHGLEKGLALEKRLSVQSGQFFKIGCVYDTSSAQILESAGFHALWVNVVALSATQFAAHEISPASREKTIHAVRQICLAVKKPVIVDLDNGFKDRKEAYSLVIEYGLAGAAGICINDNIYQKRCSLYNDPARGLYSIEEMMPKFKAAKLAAGRFGMTVIGRVESLMAGLELEDALQRANAYADAGADMVLISSRTFAPLCEISMSGRLRKPLIVAPPLGGYTTLQEMAWCRIAGAVLANRWSERPPAVKPLNPDPGSGGSPHPKQAA